MATQRQTDGAGEIVEILDEACSLLGQVISILGEAETIAREADLPIRVARRLTKDAIAELQTFTSDDYRIARPGNLRALIADLTRYRVTEGAEEVAYQ